MKTVKSKKSGRVYEVRARLYGAHKYMCSVFYGGVHMADSDAVYDIDKIKSMLKLAVARADVLADRLGIEVSK